MVALSKGLFNNSERSFTPIRTLKVLFGFEYVLRLALIVFELQKPQTIHSLYEIIVFVREKKMWTLNKQNLNPQSGSF